jgi:hypothetical protein
LTKIVNGIGVHKRFRVEEKGEGEDFWLDEGEEDEDGF